MTCGGLFLRRPAMFTKLLPVCVQGLQLNATSCSSEASLVVFKHQLLAQNFCIWCWFFINFNIHIVWFCWYQSFRGMSLQCNVLGKIARNKTSQFTLIQLLPFMKWPVPFWTCHSPNPRTTGVHATPLWEKGKTRKASAEEKKKLIVLLTVLPQSV